MDQRKYISNICTTLSGISVTTLIYIIITNNSFSIPLVIGLTLTMTISAITGLILDAKIDKAASLAATIVLLLGICFFFYKKDLEPLELKQIINKIDTSTEIKENSNSEKSLCGASIIQGYEDISECPEDYAKLVYFIDDKKIETTACQPQSSKYDAHRIDGHRQQVID